MRRLVWLLLVLVLACGVGDGRAAMVRREVSAAGAGAVTMGSVVSPRFAMDGPGVPESAVSRVYIARGVDMGGGVGGVLYTERPGADGLRIHGADARGDVVSQVDGNGEVRWAASYAAYGTRVQEASAGGAPADRFRANSKEEDPTGLLNEGFRYRDLETGTFISRDPLGFVDGPNVYAYVQQNPWTKFDPEGLESAQEHAANASWAAKNGKYLDMIACTFMSFGRAMNPADPGSELRQAAAKMPAAVDNARQEINKAPIPTVMKVIAKAGLATAGNADPIQMLQGGVDLKQTVKENGWGTIPLMWDGIKRSASEDPAYFVAQLTSGYLMAGGGNVIKKPGSGVLLNSGKEVAPNATPRLKTVLGSGQDVAPYLNKQGYNVLEMDRTLPLATRKQINLQWLDDAIDRGDEIILKTDPIKWDRFMREIGKESFYNELELPRLLQRGVIDDAILDY